jgi:hypothetical protein
MAALKIQQQLLCRPLDSSIALEQQPAFLDPEDSLAFCFRTAHIIDSAAMKLSCASHQLDMKHQTHHDGQLVRHPTVAAHTVIRITGCTSPRCACSPGR